MRNLPLCPGTPQVLQTVGAQVFRMDVMFMAVEVERGTGFVVSAGEFCGRTHSTTEMTSEPHLSAPSPFANHPKFSS